MAALIAYFSRADQNYFGGRLKNISVGNTEQAARILEKITGADMFKIEPVQPYSKDYNICISQAQEDQLRNARPELTHYPESIDQYDVIYLGYPNYWGTMPMQVFTFLEHFDFNGKTICPFCTHEGSGIGRSEADINIIWNLPEKMVSPEYHVRLFHGCHSLHFRAFHGAHHECLSSASASRSRTDHTFQRIFQLLDQ